MSTIDQTFVDVVLADIIYVNGFARGLTGNSLRDLVQYRVPLPLAQEIGDRFIVLGARDDATSNFQGVVFQDKVDGAIYVANRGTTLGQDIYDADLDLTALSGLARNQVAAMVNWWQDIASQPGTNFTTIAAVPVGSADPRTFIASGSKQASGLIATELAQAHAQGNVRIVGHSLGGHLATVLASLFADQVDHSSTFNGAGLDSILALRQNLQNFLVGAPLQEAATLIGRAIQLPGEGKQDNYFAANGLSLTTSDFVFRQLGRRISVYNEYTKELVPPFYRNHSIYKQTDSLALFRVLEKLDPNVKLGALSGLAEAGSSSQPSSLEALLDGLRATLLGSGLAPTPVSDDGGDWEARNMPPQRAAYYANLKSLVEAQAFQDVAGKVDLVSLVAGAGGGLASTAKTSYGDFIALRTLSPFALRPKSGMADAASALDALWRAAHAEDFMNWTADKSARLYGDTGKDFEFTDQWYADRSALLQWNIKLNGVDFSSSSNARYGGGAPTWFDDRTSGNEVWIDSPTGLRQAVMPIVRFGTDAAESDLDGQAKDDHLYGMGGADTISGNGGSDYVEGNADNDTLNGNDGNDTLLGGEGDDSVYGDAGDDKLYGGQGIDTLEGGDGRDQLVGGSDVDHLRGGAGVDTLDGGAGNDLLTGGIGDDTLKGGDGNDIYILAVDDGDDTIDDSDGLGEIRIGADKLVGGDALTAGLWQQTANGKEIRYAFTPDASGRGDLLIQSSAGSTTVKHFKSGDLGIVLNAPGQLPIQLPTPIGSILGTSSDDNRMGDASHRPVLGFGANDRVQGLAGRDEVAGGSGDDVVEGGSGIDVVAGNSGNDAVFSDALLTGVQLRDYITTSATVPTAGSMPTKLFVATSEWLQGGLGDDTVVGADGNDIIFGGGGKDMLVGGAGHDLINGDDDYEPADIASIYVQPASGAGAPFDAWYSSVLAYSDSTMAGDADEIHAGSGDDAVYGERGDDTIWGDDGNDTMSGGAGGDVLLGGNGDDRLAGDDYGKLVGSSTATSIGDDYIEGGSGNDQIFGDGGEDTLLGGAGNDIIRGNNDVSASGASPTAADDGNDYINGGSGNDTLIGDSASDTIIGGDGNDTMFGDSDAMPVAYQGGDYLDGGTGSDYLRGYGGNDTLLGGDGNDQVTGDAGDDYIDVGTGDNAVSGGDGNDVIIAAVGATAALSGNNSFMGDAGDDWISGEGRLWGGDGDDTLTTRGYYADPAQQSVMQGGNGNDTLNATFGGASMYGDAGDDVFTVGAGTAYMSGGTGSDAFGGGTGSDYAWGEDGDDQAVGGDGNDQLSGGAGNDRLVGDAGDDVIFGDEGDDTLAGGPGFNYLDGGAGNDRYLIDAADGSSTIVDTQGTNVIEFADGITAAQLTFLQGIDQDGNDRYLVIDGAGGHGRGSVVIGGGLDATVSTFRFSDGSSLTAQQARDLALAETARLRAQVQVRPLSLKGSSGDDTIAATATAQSVSAGAGNDTLTGGSFDDSLSGDAGNDWLIGGGGSNVLTGGDGTDTYVLGASDGGTTIVERHVSTQSETDTIQFIVGIVPGETRLIRDGSDLVVAMKNGGAQARIRGYFVTTSGGSSVDQKVEKFQFAEGTIWTGAQLDSHIEAGTGNAMVGTSADDTFIVDSAQDTVTELANGGNDTIQSSVSYALPAYVEKLVLTGVLDASAWGNVTNAVNYLIGNDGNNTFNGPNSPTGAGAGGNSVMSGGKGDDTYYYDSSKGGSVNENPNEGNDTIILTRGAGNFVLPSNVENVIDTNGGMNRVTNGGDTLTGNDLDNFLGYLGPSTGHIPYYIDGGRGADTMQGSLDDDVYVVDNPGDRVIESGYAYSTSLHDEVRSSVSFELPDNVELLTMTGSAPVDGWGNELDNFLYGTQNAAANRLSGGLGNDWYVVGPNDSVVENEDEGSDTMEFHGTGMRTYSFADVAANVEGLALGEDLGASSIKGDSGDNSLIGNASSNVLTSGDGDDTIAAGSGDDTLAGGTGDDLLQGQGGVDAYMFSRGFGRDTVQDVNGSNHIVFDSGVNSRDVYFEDGILKVHGTSDQIVLGKQLTYYTRTDGSPDWGGFIGDVTFADGTTLSAVELNAQVAASFSHSSSSHADLLTGTSGVDQIDGLAGDDFIYGLAGNDTLTGGDHDDRIFGGDGVDAITGDGGKDQLFGGAGDDNIAGGVGLDAIQGDGGNDTLAGGADADTIHGDAGNDMIDGQSENDALFGDDGSDVIAGGTGNDTLYGGTGNDTLRGGADNDQLYGEDGNDLLIAGDPADSTDFNNYLDGGNGDDILVGGDWMDSLVGGGGNDRLDGGAGSDNLYDTSGDNTLSGGDGDDTLQVLDGNNVLDGGTGVDFLRGGAGVDSYILRAGGGIDTVVDNWYTGQNSIILVDSALRPADVALTREDDGTGSCLVVSANGGADALWLRYAPAQAPVEIRFADGTTWDPGAIFDRLYVRRGTAGSDTLTAGLGDFQLFGYAGNDTLIGGAGNDLLDGGTGPDSMTGGGGNDTYIVDDAGDVVVGSSTGYDTVKTVISYVLPANVESLVLVGASSINGTGNNLANKVVGNAGNNVLDGKAGADTLQGGAGNDTYVIDNAGDAVTENVGEGVDLVQSNITYALGANLENLALTGSAAINGTGNAGDNAITGNAGVNTLTGGLGNDVIDGGAGADALKGGVGNDVYVIDNASDVITELVSEGTDVAKSSVTYTIGANIENLTLTGMAAINGTGNALNNVIVGNSANNVLSGGAGADTMAGGAGNDTYVVDNASDVVTESTGEGTDLVQSGINYVLPGNVENLTLTGTGAINGTGNALNNALTGNAGNNVLNGGTGTDIMAGGIGNDTYVVDVATDVVSEATSAGTDNVNASISYVLTANVENLTLTGTGAINATGNALANTLTGNAGNNILNGGIGTDIMRGGLGDDTYVVDAATDVVTENANEGADGIQSSISLTLAANVEYLTLTGAATINGIGNTLNNWLQGNTTANTMDGGSGNDALWGAAGDDVLLGNAGNDLMQGGQGNDALTDIAGNNCFDGGAGADTLTGGAAHDMFVGGTGVDTLITGGGADVIAFNKGDGADVVNASVGTDDTLTLGGGLPYSDLKLRKTGLDLVLDAGNGDQITFRNWYQTGVNNKSVLNLQVVADAMAAFNPGGSDPLLNRKLVNFNFIGLVGQFDAALLANPTLTSWNLTNALTTYYLSGSDTAAIGGDFAYDYGHRNALTNIGEAPAQTVLAGATFGSGAQTLQAAATLYAGTIRLQ